MEDILDMEGAIKNMESANRINFMGVPIDAISMEETVAYILTRIENGLPSQHMAINPGKIKAVLKCRFMSQIRSTTLKLSKMILLTIKVYKLKSSTKKTTPRCFTQKDRILIGHLLSTSTPSKRLLTTTTRRLRLHQTPQLKSHL